ncbi:hypothetical protein G6F43_010691 [Rhizopus delemar]|nr:hypothetical protein G6F43_010691 [Rhizopus delemar]
MAIPFATFMAYYYYLENGVYPSGCDTMQDKQKIQYQASKYFVQDGRLLEVSSGRELVHEATVWSIVKAVHEEGHFGILNTLKKLRSAYVCSGARQVVTEVVKGCETCQFREKVRRVRSNPGYIIKTPRHPFYMVGCDAVGPLQVTIKGNRYILTATDYLTRWPMAMAVPDINERTTARFLYDHIISNYGVPNYLLTDRGSNFTSTYFHEFLKSIGCKHITTTSWRPNCNGAVERLNQTLCNTMAKLARDEDKINEWDDFINPALLALRTMENSATGFTPGFLLFGYTFQTPITWKAPRLDFVEGDWEGAVEERLLMIKEKLKDARAVARSKSDERKKKEKRLYDRRIDFVRQFEIGELVLLRDMVPTTKFSDKWIGPFTVVRVNKNGTYHLAGKNSRRLEGAVNGDMLKTFEDAKHMVPDVLVTKAHQQFQSWVERKSTVLGVVHPILPAARDLRR